MSSRRTKSVTLTELLIAMVLLFMIVMGFSSIETFSRRGLLATARRSEIQNEVSYVLNHIAKQATRAIGSQAIGGQEAVDEDVNSTNTYLEIHVDAGADHESTGNGTDKRADGGLGGDCWRAYRWRNDPGSPSDRYQIWYYSNYNNPSDPYEVLARRIQSFTVLPSPVGTQNYFEVTIASCWDPTQPAGLDNPCITASSRVVMPSVSTQ